MASQEIKKASSMSAGQLLAKKHTLVQFLPLFAKKPTLAQSFLLQVLLFCRHGASVRDLFKEEIDNRRDNNNNDNKTANNNFSLEKFSEYDNDI